MCCLSVIVEVVCFVLVVCVCVGAGEGWLLYTYEAVDSPRCVEIVWRCRLKRNFSPVAPDRPPTRTAEARFSERAGNLG